MTNHEQALSPTNVPQFAGFTPDVLTTLLTGGIAERWAAVQERLHPTLAALVEALQVEGARRFPRE